MKSEVKKWFPASKQIFRGGIYMIVEWDAFFAVGPLLGQGSTPEEAWSSVSIPRPIPATVNSAVLMGENFFRGTRGRKMRSKR